ncbi:MAG TPA: hypothetical protein VH165_29890 [Kofleriaceae bacterium]|nr:hypothetical protein [Kofleriaceae bacterium]
MPPPQTPAAQVLFVMHALPSSHVTPSALAGLEQSPVAVSQVPASWQESGAPQMTGSPLPQTPAVQVLFVMHALPSSHAAPSVLTGSEQSPVDSSQVPTSWHVSDALQVTSAQRPASGAPGR